jgi:uncharacterized protein
MSTLFRNIKEKDIYKLSIGTEWRLVMVLDRINSILNNTTYKTYLKNIKECEKERIFCCHDISHFMDVARIAYIINLENNYGYLKDIIYGAALLHDIGRWKQYLEGIPHDEASAELALPILVESGYDKGEIHSIIQAILNHRKSYEDKHSLSHIIYFSDKASRACYNCKAIKECNWSSEKINNLIKY